ncbi:membrane protein [Cerasicoccus arenae]|uniref:Membrane protein n=2 Tax=Cerasicoccus arenae TaxID=424488 RepID=A0A8J3DH16_9BACT|nr:membrane protein [Cerasicoccus arenae]
MIALIIGVIGIAIALIGLVMDLTHGEGRVGQSWLIAYGFWMAMLIGMLFLTQLTYLFDAGWAVVVRRQWENAFAAFPWMALILVPVVALPFFVSDSSGAIWEWMDPSFVLPGIHATTVGNDALYIAKEKFLNVPFFIVRLVIYFAVFCGLGSLLRKHSIQNDAQPDANNWLACRKISAIGIYLTAFATTFMAFDLFMSLSYHWFSTMYGVWFFAASMRAGLAGTVILCNLAGTKGWLQGFYNKHHNYFLGCLCLAFTVFWAYISFSQYFLIYNANIPEETFWFNIREMNADGSKNSWWWVSMALIFGHFLIPFLVLLFYKTKVIRNRLMGICGWILAFTLLDMYWNILPKQEADDSVLGYYVQQFIPNVWDIAALVGIGGIVIWATLRSAAKHKPIPLNDPRIKESLHAHQ